MVNMDGMKGRICPIAKCLSYYLMIIFDLIYNYFFVWRRMQLDTQFCVGIKDSKAVPKENITNFILTN